ncbi:hypothetical protein R1A27_20230 [Methylobacterium sp. NMS12]|uniref:hypothetical protein n=1 Tax=Methylobacterium sp. NMS12 TaxID=3079766 RepID=UPI003F880582
MAMAAILGWTVTLVLTWQQGAFVALLVGPLVGSTTAIGAMLLFWFAEMIVRDETAAN